MSYDSTAARQAMIDSQLRTNGVIDPGLLHGFATIPRERFVPQEFGRNAYVDDTLHFAGGFLPEPLVTARLLQAAGLHPDDTAFVFGDLTGYTAALLSDLVTRVIVAAPGKPDVWNALDLKNIDVVAESAASGPYSLVVVAGAVAEIPARWLDLLGPRGRLVTVLRPAGKTGTLVLVEKDAAGVFGRRALFDAELPYLPGHAPQPVFQF